MENKLNKKYGLITAICMVVGIVIGSGVFFKSEKVLNATGGNMWLSIVAWIIGGAIMLSCVYVFSILATKHEKVNGVVDYAEKLVGKKFGYFVGWFMSIVYSPALTAVLCWVSARYTAVLFGINNPINSAEVFTIAAVYMVIIYAMNVLSPKIAGKFQVSTTIIKLIPIMLMAIVGTIMGLVNGTTIANFSATVANDVATNPLMTAIVATAFAYEGWIIATSINSEIKNSKKNLPLALMVGSAIIIVIYILYFIGIAGAMPAGDLMANGEAAVGTAYEKIFGAVGFTVLFTFIVISCLGTTNGLMLSTTRGLYAVASRNVGPSPKLMGQVDKETNMPNNAATVGLVVTAIWLLVWFGNFAGWWGNIFLDISELPIVTIYALYIPMFISMMITHKDLKWWNRFIAPIVAIIGSIAMVVAAVYSHGIAVVWYLIIFIVVMGIGALFLIKPKSKTNITDVQTITTKTSISK